MRQQRLATVDQGDYHSRHSVYGDGSFKEVLGEQPRVPVPGNFGGTAYAEGILDWSRQMLENFVRFCPHIHTEQVDFLEASPQSLRYR